MEAAGALLLVASKPLLTGLQRRRQVSTSITSLPLTLSLVSSFLPPSGLRGGSLRVGSPQLVAANCRWFDFGGCVFTKSFMSQADKRDGLSREGSARVAIYKVGLLASRFIQREQRTP